MSSAIEGVLVVEDEGMIRMAVVDELQDAGFIVLEAGNADEAMVILERNPAIHAVFTDVDMPGSMNGVQLAQAIRKAYPDTFILVASDHLKVPRNFIPDDIPFFAKPYDLTKVIEVISSPPQSPAQEWDICLIKGRSSNCITSSDPMEKMTGLSSNSDPGGQDRAADLEGGLSASLFVHGGTCSFACR